MFGPPEHGRGNGITISSYYGTYVTLSPEPFDRRGIYHRALKVISFSLTEIKRSQLGCTVWLRQKHS